MANKSYDTIEALMSLITQYIHNPESIAMITKAYDIAAEMHKDQKRKSGEPYIIHPLNVTAILAQLRVGPDTLCAGLLHDVVEDTPYTIEQIEREFNRDVAVIVDGVTKVNQLKFVSLEEKQVQNHQHMLLAMAKDIRVVIVKLADRLHNIRTLDAMIPEKQVRIAKETLEIYAPLASKLGIFVIKAELEDTCLRYVEPKEYSRIVGLLKSDSTVRMSNVDKTIAEIRKILDSNNVTKYDIKGRVKNIYSIYKKMVTKNKDFKDIYDILAIRIIVDSIPECYQALGLIHANYTPIPKRFKDYIAVPKPNMYQSLHTTVISSNGFTFEVQIRTKSMDDIAELGVAAHWAYKENATYSKEREQFEIASKLKWYGTLLKFNEDQDESNNGADDYVESIKEDILASQTIYVYTPDGKVIDLPQGSTPIDFAYKIHTNIGNTLVGAIVNNHIVPLDYELETGDIIECKTNKNSFGPSENWLKIIRTSHARHKIKSFLNKQNKDVLLARGKEAIENEFNQQKVKNYLLNDEFAGQTFYKNNINCLDDLYQEVAKGNISPKTVVSKYLGDVDIDANTAINRQIERSQKQLETNSETGVIVEGLPNPMLHLGSCCNPIPGDKIVGYVTKGNGIVVHHVNCNNINGFESQRLIPLKWSENIQRKYPVAIKIESKSDMNLLLDVMNVVSSSGMSILAINAKNNDNLTTIVKLKVMCQTLLDLEHLIVNLKKIKSIYNIERDNL